MNIYDWAVKWNVPAEAMHDLTNFLTAATTEPKPMKGKSEAAVQAAVELEMAEKGGLFFRNNVGVAFREDGAPVRFGFANESAEENRRLKSSDLIGLRPIRITQAHVGRIIGQFVVRETKKVDWVYKATPRELAQLNFIILISLNGGDARFANKVGTL